MIDSLRVKWHGATKFYTKKIVDLESMCKHYLEVGGDFSVTGQFYFYYKVSIVECCGSIWSDSEQLPIDSGQTATSWFRWTVTTLLVIEHTTALNGGSVNYISLVYRWSARVCAAPIHACADNGYWWCVYYHRNNSGVRHTTHLTLVSHGVAVSSHHANGVTVYIYT